MRWEHLGSGIKTTIADGSKVKHVDNQFAVTSTAY